MQLSLFYIKELSQADKYLILDEENSKHAIQVLRMKTGENLMLTDGEGHFATATVTNDHKKHCKVIIQSVEFKESVQPEIAIAISPVKNNNRFEWFLEKAAEIGINTIIPLICARTEKERFKTDRWQNILVSAMLQSRQHWLTRLMPPMDFDALLSYAGANAFKNKFIAHCLDDKKSELQPAKFSSVILIGPEGDFTEKEIQSALQNDFEPVTLGNTRLRTETAGVVAAARMR